MERLRNAQRGRRICRRGRRFWHPNPHQGASGHRGDAKFALVPCPIDLRSGKADANALIALIREVETEFGEACVLLVIDTLSRAMAGGDENSSTDMAQFVANVDRIRDATKSHVLVIHHTGKDKTKGARGHSSLRAAADTELEVTPSRLLKKSVAVAEEAWIVSRRLY